MAQLILNLLGSFEIARDGIAIKGFEYNKVRALLAYLAVEAQQPHTRSSLATLFWPEQSERAARANLSQALTTLRNALNDRTNEKPFISADSDTVQFKSDSPYTLDVLRFNALLDEAEMHKHRHWHICVPCAARLREAVALYRGDFLAQFFLKDSEPFEEWATIQRERLRQRALSALEHLTQFAEWRGQLADAIQYARRQIEIEPLLEAGHRELMRLLALNQQTTAALAQFATLSKRLSNELAAAPEAETVALEQQIRRTTRDPVVALRRFQKPTPSLPALATPLIGRDADRQAICALLRDGHTRALTLTGAPGIGKTRLAQQIAHDLRFDFEHGVYFIELAPLADATQVASALAQALAIKESGAQPLPTLIISHLRPKHLLLVLDNFEHVLDATALIADCLIACPALSVLITSRTPLNLRAEQQYPLMPLSLPLADEVDNVAQSAAVQLFMDRARAVQPTLALSPDNASAIADICRQLDGLPLAIELVAARVKTRSPIELLPQLQSRLAALADGPRDLPERHRNLRNAIHWSYDRLSADEQRVFAYLGVFVGGCTAEAAQAVGGETSLAPILESLQQSSLLYTQTFTQETRFLLLETLREFALEQLAAHQLSQTARRRHADYFLALAERANAALDGPDQLVWLERLTREHANFRAALEWSLANACEQCLRMTNALGPYWETRGHGSEGRRWLADGLQSCTAAAMPLRAWALNTAGRLARLQGQLNEAERLLDQSLSLFRHLEEPAGIAAVLLNLGISVGMRTEFDHAEQLLRECLELEKHNHNSRGESEALSALGVVAQRGGRFAQAQDYFKQALAIRQALKDPRNSAGIMANIGTTAYQQGEFELARQQLEASAEVFQQLADKRGMIISLGNLSNVLLYLGELDAACTTCEKALQIAREVQDHWGLSINVGNMGRLHLRAGRMAAARQHLYEGLQMRAELGERRLMAGSLEDIAEFAHANQQHAHAARLIGAAEALRALAGSPRIPVAQAAHDQLVQAIRAKLSDGVFDSTVAAGYALNTEQAVAFALACVESASPHRTSTTSS